MTSQTCDPSAETSAWSMFFENNPAPSCIVETADSVILAVNIAFSCLFGYSVQEASGLPLSRIFSDADWRRFAQQSEHAAAPSQHRGTWQQQHKDGSLLCATISASNITHQGRRCRLLIFNDVTDLHQSHQSGKRAEQLLESLFNLIPDRYFLVDSTGLLLDYRGPQNGGYDVSVEQSKHQKIAEVLPADIGLLFEKHLAVAKSCGSQTSFEYSLNMPQGIRCYEARLCALDQGDSFIIIVRDITQRHQALQALQDSEEHLRSIADNTYDWEYWRTPDGTLAWISPACTAVSGYPVQQFQDDFDAMMARIIHPEDRHLWQKFNHIPYSAENTSQEKDFRIIKPDGTTLWIHHTCKPITSPDGRYFGLRGCNRDVTNQKQVELELSQEQWKLKERIKEQNCLADILVATSNTDLPLANVLQNIVQHIPAGWQFPGIAAARIEWDGQCFDSPGFLKTPWMLQAESTTKEEETLRITVVYREKCPDRDIGPFLEEERTLLESILEHLLLLIIRRKSQTALSEHEALLETMFLQTSDAIALFDVTTARFISFNESAYQGLGYSREEFAQLPIEAIQTEHSHEIIRANISKVLSGETIAFTGVHHRKNGERQDVSVTLKRVHHAGRPLICSVWRDITEQKAHEREQMAHTERLRQYNHVFRLMNQSEAGRSGHIVQFAHETNELIGEVLRISRVSIWLFNEDETLLVCRDLYDITTRQHFSGSVLKKDEYGPEFKALQNNRYVDANDALHDPRTAGYVDTYLKPAGITSMLDCAIISTGRNIGTVCFEYVNQNHVWTADEITFGCQVADHIALAIVNGQREAGLKALRESENFLSTLIESIPAPVFYKDAEGRYISCNSAYEQFYGISKEDILGKTVFDISPPELAQIYHARDMELIATGGVQRYESRLKTRHGELHDVIFNKAAYTAHGGEIVGIVGAILDITSRKQTEDALRENEARLRSITENAQDAIIMMGPTGEVTFWNPAAERILGYSADEILGQHVHSILAPTRYHRANSEAMPRFYASGKGDAIGKTVHLQALRKDGKEIEIALSLSSLHLGGAWHALGIVRDITVQIETERELADYRAHLEELVQVRTTELEAAKLAAETANTAKSAFLSNMSHEIRTPMNAIIGYAHLLKQEPLSSRQISQLGQLSGSAQHLLQIINDILDLSKIEANKIILHIHDFEPARMIDQVCAALAHLVQSKGLELLVDLDHLPLVVQGDGLRFTQIMLNLASNAVKFTEKGTIRILGQLLDEDAACCRYRFTVVDTGIGIAPQALERLFLAFEQADSSTTRRFGGTGLGLAISKKLAELMGGSIGVASEVGTGSRFWIDLPFTSSESSKQVLASLAPLSGRKVLIIDTSPDTQNILTTALGALGLHATAVGSGKEGAAALLAANEQHNPFGVILIDWHQTGSNGIKIARYFREQYDCRATIFLISASLREQISQREVEQAGISAILTKPLTSSILYDALTGLLGPKSGNELATAKLDHSAELEKRRGSRILVVEDNVINQEVTSQLLEMIGMRVSLAANGQQAIKMAGTGIFDLVLMDVQMPVMNGLEASKEIRRIPSCRKLPILAMTSNAFVEDREACLLAGMNDHLPKPVEPEYLYGKLIQWLPAFQATDDFSDKGIVECIYSPDTSNSELLLALQKIEGVETSVILRSLKGNINRYLNLLERFIDDHGNDITQLERHIFKKDWNAARQTAHGLKGAAGVLGLTGVQKSAAAFEEQAKLQCTGNEAPIDVTALRNELSQLVASLRAVLINRTRIAGSVPFSPEKKPE